MNEKDVETALNMLVWHAVRCIWVFKYRCQFSAEMGAADKNTTLKDAAESLVSPQSSFSYTYIIQNHLLLILFCHLWPCLFTRTIYLLVPGLHIHHPPPLEARGLGWCKGGASHHGGSGFTILNHNIWRLLKLVHLHCCTVCFILMLACVLGLWLGSLGREPSPAGWVPMRCCDGHCIRTV